MSRIGERLQRLIAASGPICVAHYMAEANAHYYATRDPFGAGGDFTTAPEISQMFGELIGLWLADLWDRAGRPLGARYVELGPGRGTLAADALRAILKAELEPPVELVETSPALRRAQAERLPQAAWHNDIAALPEDGPILAVANEFFDAVPARQLVATEAGWRERLVACEGGRFVPVAGNPIPSEAIPPALQGLRAGEILETSPAAGAIVRQLARRIIMHGGAALIVDYGHVRTGVGDTLQAVSAHDYADPWIEPGERDLTVHVDFEALAAAARDQGARVHGPVPQGQWLQAMGIDLRASALSRASPEQARAIAAARARLVAPDQMGELFKVMALTSPDWPEPAGFQ
jgi:NADH dehydrogenase [ubiquinone] 1 alpha subcomplex assembly factor 7